MTQSGYFASSSTPSPASANANKRGQAGPKGKDAAISPFHNYTAICAIGEGEAGPLLNSFLTAEHLLQRPAGGVRVPFLRARLSHRPGAGAGAGPSEHLQV